MGSIVFVGYMGAGKTVAAAATGEQLGLRVHHSDDILDGRLGVLGTSIETYIHTHGEAAFRRQEEIVNLELLELDGAIIDLGGGAIMSDRVRTALQSHLVVYLPVDVDTAWQRCSGSGRPLATDYDQFAAELRRRQSLYDSVANVTVIGDVDENLVTLLPTRSPQSQTIWARYPVHVGPRCWPLPQGRSMVITDATVGGLYGDWLDDDSFVIDPGEQSKTLQTAEAIWTRMAERGFTRADTVVALGGGVVGDLAGFVAASYQRGMPVIHLPTTVVAQVDSAYGGKTGVDLPSAKNYVGAYHQPSAVYVDPRVLDTLAPEEYAAGYVEVIKTALIAGGELWERVSRNERVDAAMINACARTKLAIVAADERDDGVRQTLNLGHTIGHALETVTEFKRFRHGEAIGLGLLAALRINGQDSLHAQVTDLLRENGLPLTTSGIDVDAVIAAVHGDKKRVGEHVPFVLVEAPGDVTYNNVVDERLVRDVVAELVL